MNKLLLSISLVLLSFNIKAGELNYVPLNFNIKEAGSYETPLVYTAIDWPLSDYFDLDLVVGAGDKKKDVWLNTVTGTYISGKYPLKDFSLFVKGGVATINTSVNGYKGIGSSPSYIVGINYKMINFFYINLYEQDDAKIDGLGIGVKWEW